MASLLHSARAVFSTCALLVSLITIVAAQDTIIPPICHEGVQIIAVVGSNVTNGTQSYGLTATFVQTLMLEIPDSSNFSVNYNRYIPYGQTAKLFMPEVEEGVPALESAITSYTAACPHTPIVIHGYSEGAVIVGNLLCGASSGAFPVTSPMDSSYASNIIAVILYGDEARTANQSYNQGDCTANGPHLARRNPGGCDAFAPAMQSYCSADDADCCGSANATAPWPTSTNPHWLYPLYFDIPATDFVISRYQKYKNGSMSSGSTTSTTVSSVIGLATSSSSSSSSSSISRTTSSTVLSSSTSSSVIRSSTSSSVIRSSTSSSVVRSSTSSSVIQSPTSSSVIRSSTSSPVLSSTSRASVIPSSTSSHIVSSTRSTSVVPATSSSSTTTISIHSSTSISTIASSTKTPTISPSPSTSTTSSTPHSSKPSSSTAALSSTTTSKKSSSTLTSAFKVFTVPTNTLTSTSSLTSTTSALTISAVTIAPTTTITSIATLTSTKTNTPRSKWTVPTESTCTADKCLSSFAAHPTRASHYCSNLALGVATGTPFPTVCAGDYASRVASACACLVYPPGAATTVPA